MARPKKGYAARLTASNARTGRALAGFESAVQELDAAAEEQQQLVEDLAHQINALSTLQAQADKASMDNVRVANRLRELIS